MYKKIRYMLLQVRDADDPMRRQEVDCFARALQASSGQFQIYDILSGVPTRGELDAVDVVLLGGSGDYSVAEGGSWLPRALETMQELYEFSKPTFASCWGFQAFARAMGGYVVSDLSRAELGTLEVALTDAGRKDPIFAPLGDLFDAQMGHQDIVERLPAGAVLLASTEKVKNQAFCFPDKPIYCTQFHPELDRASFLQRVEAYPEYVPKISGSPLEEFSRSVFDTPNTESLLSRFVGRIFA